MPRIRTFVARPDLPQPVATGQQFGADVGRAITDVGGRVTQAGQVADDIMTRKDQSEIDASASKIRLELRQKIKDQSRNADLNSKTFNKDFMENEVEPLLAGLGENARTVRARDHAQSIRTQTNELFQSMADDRQFELEGLSAIKDVQDMEQASLNNIFAFPEMMLTETSAYMEAVTRQQEAGLIDAVTADKMVTDFRNRAGQSAAEAGLVQDPAQLLADIDEQIYDGHLDFNQLANYRSRAKTAIKGAKDASLRIALDDLEEQLRQQAATGSIPSFTKDDAKALAGGDELKASRIEEQFDKSTKMGDIHRTTKGTPLNEHAERVATRTIGLKETADFDVEAPAAALDAEVFTQRQRAWAADPAGWSMGESPTTAQAFNTAVEQDTSDAWSVYFRTTQVEQERLIPGVTPTLLPAAQVAQVKALMEQANTEGGSQAALDVLISLQSNAGAEFSPQVMGELRNAEAINGTQFAASHLAMHGNPSLARRMMAVSNESASKLAEDSGLTGIKRDIVQEVVDQFEDRRATFQLEPGGLQRATDFESAATLLALSDSRMAGEDMTNQVSKIINALEAGDVNVGTYRIPDGQDVSSIRRGTNAMRNKLGDFDLIAPPTLTGLREEDAIAEIKKTLPFSGVYVTNDNATGVYVLDSRDTRARVYHNVEGKVVPLQFTWDELEELGLTETAGINIKLGKGLD